MDLVQIFFRSGIYLNKINWKTKLNFLFNFKAKRDLMKFLLWKLKKQWFSFFKTSKVWNCRILGNIFVLQLDIVMEAKIPGKHLSTNMPLLTILQLFPFSKYTPKDWNQIYSTPSLLKSRIYEQPKLLKLISLSSIFSQIILHYLRGNESAQCEIDNFFKKMFFHLMSKYPPLYHFINFHL